MRAIDFLQSVQRGVGGPTQSKLREPTRRIGLWQASTGTRHPAERPAPGGHQQRGRWSIGQDGRLHASGEGRDRATDAWVAGDVLTVAENGQGMAYRRAAAN